MGRKKIQITRIVDERNRQVTFMKRKFGLMKKAYELSILCDCEIALIIFNGSNKLFQYASTDMDKVLLKYTEYNEPHESRTNSDIVETLNKKEQRCCDSPDADPSHVLLNPHTDEKYKKINEEFDNMMKSHKISSGHLVHGGAGSMAYTPTPGGVTSQALAAATAALAHSGISSYPYIPDGLHGGSDLALQNGSGPGAGNGFVASAGGRCFGKILPPKSSPPPPLHGSSLVSPGCKTDLPVVVPHSKGTMQTVSNQRVNQSSQPLSTPVVSMATPCLPAQNLLYSSIGSAYSNEFSLSSAELSGFGSSLSSMSPWQQQQQQQLSSLRRRGSNLPLSINHNISIKAEPISPPRDHFNQAGYLRPHHSGPAEMGRSPSDSVGSSCSSQEEQQMDFHGLQTSRSEGPHGPALKRMRMMSMDSWVT
ncbi:myocyte-specific enhancer factor 2A-like [Gouania willdenowi]|uniref:myocyte-specific enhancer factor 2A-like n=1 Tax=Gouania willdenowi TaxID=441366 RepID=UPI001056535E|nr:myocyte-specific enhancer factor 2A-like [Gouania willdenowi]